LVPAALGLYARFNALDFWEQNKSAFFVENRPIFTAYDSYIFARWAVDYDMGVFKPGGNDTLRAVPDGAKYPKTIPLVSWLPLKLSKLFNTYIENVTFWLIPLLAVLVVVPLVLWGWRLGLPLAGFTAATVTVISLIYLTRTGLNRYDTDALNLFFTFSIPLAALLYARERRLKKKYLYLLLLATLNLLFFWWYFHPLFSLMFFLSTLLFIFLEQNGLSFSADRLRGFFKSKEPYLLLVAFNPYLLTVGIFNLVKKANDYVFGFGKPAGGFPNIRISIAELKKYDLFQLAEWTTGSLILFLLGLGGLAYFAFKRYREFALLLPPLAIGSVAFFGGSRFSMYLAPLLGFGLGVLLDLLISKLEGKFKREYLLAGTALIVAATVALFNRKSFDFKPVPIMTSNVAAAFIELGRQTPQNAWIWTWWDYGFAIQYYARRATYHDGGGTQQTPKTYFIALSFTHHSEEAGNNITKSVSVCGAKCIQELRQQGLNPEEIKRLFESGEILKKLNKEPKNPVFWLFTRDLIGKFYWISYFGTWDFKTKKGVHLAFTPFGCKEVQPKIFACRAGRSRFAVDLKGMKIVSQNRSAPIKLFAERTPQGLKILKNPYATYGYVVEKVYTFNPSVYMWFLTNEAAYRTNFNKLYLLRHPEVKQFEKTTEFFPDYVIYRVK